MAHHAFIVLVHSVLVVALCTSYHGQRLGNGCVVCQLSWTMPREQIFTLFVALGLR